MLVLAVCLVTIVQSSEALDILRWRRLVYACEVDDVTLHCEVEFGGMLCSKKGCNLPRTVTDLPAIGDKDKEDILFGIDNGAC